MSLSDGERVDGMVHAVRELTRLRGFKAAQHRPLNKLLDRLWPAMLASKGNGSFWFTGSDLGQDHLGESSLIKAAFTNVSHDFRIEGEDNTVTIQELTEEMPDSPYKELCKYLDAYKPDMHHFLNLAHCYDGASGRYELANILKVYLRCESFMYYANRYQDDLARKCVKTRNLIAKIMGFCLDRFSTDWQYLAAYMASNIFDRLLQYEVEDTVTMWFKAANMHHDVSFHHLPKSEIKRIFQEMRVGAIPSSEKRLVIILKFAGNKFHWEHQHRELLKVIKDHNQKFPQDKINAAKIQKLCAAKTAAHAKTEKKLHNNYRPWDYLFNEEVVKKSKKPKT